jgi:glycosyltransferase involved in cell wall biosynthesis
VPINDNLNFITSFLSSDFIVIFSPLYNSILDAKFIEPTVDINLSNLTERKAVIKPNISNRFLSKKDRFVVDELLDDSSLFNKIKVIVPFRNVKNFIKECSTSILNQKYRSYEVFYVDDCSEDGSIEEIHNHPNVVKIRREKRKYTLQNVYDVLTSYDFEDEDIIAIVDGDDYLLHEYALAIVNEIYNFNQCYLSYGQYINTNGYYGLCKPYTNEDFPLLRKMGWRASHLKTFKYKIYKEFLKQDPYLNAYRDLEGEFYKMASDVALMLPLLEIAGKSKVFFNCEPIYVYRLHANNDHSIDLLLQKSTEIAINSKSPFTETKI